MFLRYVGVIDNKNTEIMTKILEVTTPFFTLGLGDRFELSEDGKNYISEISETYDHSEDDGNSFVSSYESKFTISADYAKKLVEEGYLKEATNKAADSTFVNVFDEISNLLEQYTNDLKEVNEDKEQVPACLKVEKTTVLQNLIKVLTHLKSLKK